MLSSDGSMLTLSPVIAADYNKTFSEIALKKRNLVILFY